MKLIKDWLHGGKEAGWEHGEELGLTDGEIHKLIGALLEVEFLVDVETGTIFAVNGKILGTAQDYEGQPEVFKKPEEVEL